jgi:hypothetical protein
MTPTTSIGPAARPPLLHPSNGAELSAADHALLSCIISCGECDDCLQRMYAKTAPTSWLACARADDETQLMLSDIRPFSFDDSAMSFASRLGH